MKVLKKLTLVAVDEIKLHNQEMKQIFGGTYGDPYGYSGYGGGEYGSNEGEIDCLSETDPSKCKTSGSSCQKISDGKMRTGTCSETTTTCWCTVVY